MTYQQPPHQSAVDQPVGVQPVRPVVITVPTQEELNIKPLDNAAGTCYTCLICNCCIGGILLVCLVITFLAYAATKDRYTPAMNERSMLGPMRTMGKITGSCFSLALISLCIIKVFNCGDDEEESRDNTQPVAQPFTEYQRNEEPARYVPVQTYEPHGSYSDNVQQPVQPRARPATAAPSGICRQWNEGPCTFGACRHRHVCSKCADFGKPEEKHKSSSEECPNKGKNVPVQSDSEQHHPNNAPSASSSAQMNNVQQPFQHGVHTTPGYVPEQLGPEYTYPSNAPSGPEYTYPSNAPSAMHAQQPFHHVVPTTPAVARGICRQWNEGPCNFGVCRHQHVCSTCAEFGKPEEKHKASSEECPNKGMDVPVQSDPGHQNANNTPSASSSGQMSNLQQPSQYEDHNATGAQNNSDNNKGKIISSSGICRQWNEGPCSFGVCRHQHVCIACAEFGKPEEKHKASSEECPNKGRYVPPQSRTSAPSPSASVSSPSASYSGQMSNVQRPFPQPSQTSYTATGAIIVPLISGPKTPESGDYDGTPVTYYPSMVRQPWEDVVQPVAVAPQTPRIDTPRTRSVAPSGICRQWNEGPCPVGRCRHRHVCSKCADRGKPEEKHKASECPGEGSSSKSSGAGYDQPPAFAPPSYSSQGASNAGSSPQSSGAEYDQPPAFAPPSYSSQQDSNAGRYVPLQSGPGHSYPDFAPSAPYSAQMSDMQQPFQHGVDSATGGPQHSLSDRAAFVDYDQPPDFDPPPYAPPPYAP